MALTTSATAEIVKTHQRAAKDTGSPEVQVALLSKRISALTEHLKQHQHDKRSGFGLAMLVSKRRRLLRYLKNNSVERYRQLIQLLNLRG
ncbi:MAG TPA: 30S ribosomal protein S15 [Gammaproteobacteria bacterium]|nr:30S ribosomal protein S15 [Gammaproteobacteria bacterium]